MVHRFSVVLPSLPTHADPVLEAETLKSIAGGRLSVNIDGMSTIERVLSKDVQQDPERIVRDTRFAAGSRVSLEFCQIDGEGNPVTTAVSRAVVLSGPFESKPGQLGLAEVEEIPAEERPGPIPDEAPETENAEPENAAVVSPTEESSDPESAPEPSPGMP